MMKSIIYCCLFAMLLFVSCSRKGDDSPPERKGDLQADFMITDQYDLLTDVIPVKVVLYEDSLHQYEIDRKRITTAPDVIQRAEFKDINARSSFYYLQIGFDYNSDVDTSCADFPIYIEDGQIRTLAVVVLEYKYVGLECYLQ